MNKTISLTLVLIVGLLVITGCSETTPPLKIDPADQPPALPEVGSSEEPTNEDTIMQPPALPED